MRNPRFVPRVYQIKLKTMVYNVFKYSLKVWLTSVVLAPVLLHLIMYYRGEVNSLLEAFGESIVFSLFELFFSFITWLMFSVIIMVILVLEGKQTLKIWLIFIAGVLLTIGTFLATILSPQDLRGNSNPVFLILMLCNCACIGWGTWFYKLKPVTPVDEPALIENI